MKKEGKALANDTKERIALWDIVKALGIISIVLGHCCPSAEVVIFVYSYHLIVFFFAMGVLYNEEKYGDHPFGYAISRLKKLWPPYFFYYLFFILIHNLVSDDKYTLRDTAVQILKAAVFDAKETLGGAMWFIPFMLIVLFAFAGIVFVSRLVFKKDEKRNAYIAVIVASSAVGAAGLFLNYKGISLPFHLQACMLVMPGVTAGYAFSHFKLRPEKVFRIWAAIPAAAVVIISSNIQDHRVELALDQTGGAERFYLVSFCGIYLICTIALYLSKFRVTSRVFSFIGKYTFDIMSLHLFINYLVTKVFSFLPEGFAPFAWVVSLAVSMILPPLIRIAAAHVYSLLRKLCGTSRKNAVG